ncbi:MAG: riboflavin synthase [Anaerovoracaceae bacterium]
MKNIRRGAKSCQLSIRAHVIMKDIRLGDSISVNGVCLTVTSFTENEFSADVMYETLDRSSLGSLGISSKVNLERAVPVNGRFGGHIVSGHIDGTGIISAIRKEDNAIWYTIKTSEKLLRYIIEKGSVAIDGISLTVAKLEKDNFSVSVIPHTAKMTILSDKKVGDMVNLENDCIGKYVERLMGMDLNKITADFLTKYSY